MLACSYCVSVAAPGWWSFPVPFPVVALAMLGVLIGFLSLRHARGMGRTGGVLVAIGLAVVLPLAALSMRAGRTSIDVVTDDPPMDAPAWNVSCAAAVQRPGDDEFAMACSEATASWRQAGQTLAAASSVLVIAGAALAIRRTRRAPVTAGGQPASSGVE